jgi:Zn-dependent peptidase ImmA (M78 family)
MTLDDFSVRYLSNADNETIARKWRDELNSFFVSNQLDIVELFETASRCLKTSINVVVQDDAKMGRAAAYISADRQTLFVRSSLVQEARTGDPRAIFAAVHELGHLVLHPKGAPLARMIDGNIKQKFLRPEESAEHQANYFARAFLMTADEIGLYRTAEAVSEHCYTPLRQAELRVAEFRRIASVPPVPSPIDSVWMLARQAPGYDPALFRLSRGGFLAEKARLYDARHHYGWFVDHGSIVTFFEHTTD